MKQVITNFGYFLLDGTALVLMLTLLFYGMTVSGNSNLYSAIGNNLSIASIDYNNYTDFKGMYLNEAAKTPPDIYYDGGNLTLGTICLTDYIISKDYAMNTLPIYVSSIISPHGTELIDTFRQDLASITLTDPGIYTITVSSVDDGNRLTKCSIRIPVNR